MIASEEILRRLTIADPAYCQSLLAGQTHMPSTLDERSVALLRLASSLTSGSAGPMLRQRVGDAMAAGLNFDEIVASLVALSPTIGIDRIVAIAPDLASALGYDVDAALEHLDT